MCFAGAVKFGDSLTLAECVELVARLSTCRLPFQCAHGRPAVTPLVDLDHLKAKLPAEVLTRSLISTQLVTFHIAHSSSHTSVVHGKKEGRESFS